MAPLSARLELDTGDRTFASGLLLDLVAALRQTAPGDLIAITSHAAAAVDSDLDGWSRFTGHSIVAHTTDSHGTRWVIRHGTVAHEDGDARPLGEHLWVKAEDVEDPLSFVIYGIRAHGGAGGQLFHGSRMNPGRRRRHVLC